MSASTQLIPSPRVILTELGDNTGVLLHMDTKFYYTLNSTGMFVWKLVEKRHPLSTDDIAAELQARFDVTPEVAAEDVSSVVTHMRNEALLLQA